MRHLATAALMLTLWIGTASATDFQAGCEAFDRGDYEAARELWEPLAERGHPDAQFRLGCLYTFGQGVHEDYQMALALYRLAADQGNGDAQNNLGGMYAEGLGVGQDLVEAYKWFEIAAADGHAMALKNRAFIEPTLSAEQIRRAKELAGEWRRRHPVPAS